MASRIVALHASSDSGEVVMKAPTSMQPEEIVAKAHTDPMAAIALLLGHIAWSLERIATAMNEGVECDD